MGGRCRLWYGDGLMGPPKAMGSRLLMHIFVLLCLSGYASAEDPGTNFAFVSMHNVLPNAEDLRSEVLLTAFFPNTLATIQIPNKNYSEAVPLAPELPLFVELPAEMEILYATKSNHIVRITSNKPISVVATNSEYSRTSVTVLSPIEDWGTDYYVMTPDIGPEVSFRQMAIVNGPHPNFVSILLKGTVEFENTMYLAGDNLNLYLNPWEAVQLQANESLTGSHVLSQEPIALFSGRTCAEMHGRCQVCFQLPPVSAWGSEFLYPPLPFKRFSSKMYILAATETKVNLVRGFNMTNVTMTPGVVKEFDFDPMTNLFISSPGKILVFVYVGENLFEPSEGLLFNLVPKDKACASYSLVWVPRFRHTLLVVVQADGREGLQLNHQDLPQAPWRNISGTDLVYTLLPLDGRSAYYSMDNPRHSFGAIIYGMAEMNTYGAFGVCLDKVHNLCGFECRDELLCQQSACMSPEYQTCMVWGRTHLRTFQGNHHFQFGDCPLVLLASRGVDSDLGSFYLERRADYQFILKLEVFEKRIEISTKSPGTVLVNGELTYTPIVLEHGKLNIINLGSYISVKTSFGLHVILGDLGFVHVQIPRLYSGIPIGLCANPHPTEGSAFYQLNPLSWGTGITNLNCISGNMGPDLCENQDMYRLLTLCELMVNSKLFQACHSTLDPVPFIKACTFEVCWTGNVCSGLGAYALACGIEGVNMTGWRSLTGCDYSCPPNSYYSMCAPGCPATCGSNSPLDCPLACQEGCVCNPGYVLGYGGCVLAEECLCFVGGQFLKNGEAFYEEDCQVACTCMRGKVVCANHTCSANERCQNIGGITACYPKSIGCWVSGEQYHTFDGASFFARKDCLYTMVTTECPSRNITDLNIAVRLNRKALLENLSTLPNIRLKIHEHTIILQESSDGIEVDGITYPLPFALGNLSISGNYSGSNPYIQIEADPGLILMASVSLVWVNLPSSYVGNICGLCGNANGNARDDTEGQSLQDFISSWIYHNDNSLCNVGAGIVGRDVDPYNVTGRDVDPYNVTGSDVDPYNLTASCDVIVMPKGAFRNCHDVLNPSWYFHTCLNYASGDLLESVCLTIKDYAFECQSIGVTVYQWENETICGSVRSITLDETLQDVPTTQSSAETNSTPSSGRGLIGQSDPSKVVCLYESAFLNALPEGSSADSLYPVACSLLLAMVENPMVLEYFSIRIDRLIGANQSVLNLVIDVYGLHILVPYGLDPILVNKIPTILPVSLASNKVVMWFEYSNLILQTDFGLIVKFSMGGVVSISAPANYQNNLYGWCVEPGFTNVLSLDQYLCVGTEGEHWSCENETIYHHGCSLLLDEDGPFQECLKIFSPQIYYKECQRFFCENGGNQLAVCEFFQEITRICEAQGAIIQQWRNDTFC